MSGASGPLARPFAAFALMAALAAVALAFSWGGPPDEMWGRAARYTVRVSFPIFLIAFSASSLLRLWPSDATRWLVRNRRGFGLAFATAHGVHATIVIWIFVQLGELPNALTLIFGGAGFAAIAIMAATSNDWSVRTLGPRAWSRLHTVLIFYIAFVFLADYVKRLPIAPESSILGLIGIILAIGLRIAAARTRFQSA
jgi:methionine sulfoxide reductase heme-binding subunit